MICESHPGPKETTSGRLLFWAGLAVVALAFVFSAWMTWRKWPDLIVDFGLQLYIPWQIASGAVLYRDIYFFAGGPFSSCFNALLFELFGPSFSVLIISNLAAVALMLWIVYRRFCAASDAWTATTICLGIVLVFAFAQYTPNGNYNYIAPYSHDALHGLVLSIFGLAFLSDWLTAGKLRFVLAAGFCTGLVFLTKVEFFIANAATVVAAFACFCTRRRRIGRAAQSFALFLCAAILPPLMFFLYFLRVENGHDSLRAVCFAWVPLLHVSVVKNSFYLWSMGLDDPGGNLRAMGIHFLFLTGVVLFYAVVFRYTEMLRAKWFRAGWSQPLLIQIVVPVIIIFSLPYLAGLYDWRHCGASLPLLSACACVLTACYQKKVPTAVKTAFPLLWSVFGLALLLKLGLYPRIWHYGFVLAMPAFAGAIYLFVWLLPQWLKERFSVPAVRFRMTMGLALLAGFASLFAQSQIAYAGKKMAIGQDGDRIIVSGPGNEVGDESKAALEWIHQNIPTNATLAVVPEGAMFNYLTHHRNPTPCLFWDPNVMAVFGRSNMTAAFEKNPSDYIMLVDRNDGGLGAGYFGKSPDYGADVMGWIQANYQKELLLGKEPLQGKGFGIEILKRGSRPMREQN